MRSYSNKDFLNCFRIFQLAFNTVYWYNWVEYECVCVSTSVCLYAIFVLTMYIYVNLTANVFVNECFFFVIVWNANAFFPHFMVIICQVLTYLYMNESIICIHSYTYIVCLWFLYLCALIQMHIFCLRKKVGHLLLHFKCSFFLFFYYTFSIERRLSWKRRSLDTLPNFHCHRRKYECQTEIEQFVFSVVNSVMVIL